MAPTGPQCPFAPSQITQYLTRISLPETLHSLPNSTADLEFLATLQRRHLASIPFENLALHYSPNRNISLAPHDIYDKFVTLRRGGYCMEQNVFFAYMLRGLGFRVYNAGARVRRRENGVPVGDYLGWTHVVNIVTLESEGRGGQYMVDVGFGGDGPTKPLLLADGGAVKNLGTQEVMLRYENIDSNADPRQKLWVYKIRNHEMDFWKDMYCFTELEFLPQDFSVMSYFVNNSPQSWFTTTVVAVKMLLNEAGDEVVGKEMMWGADVKRNTGGRTLLIQTCGTEKERVQVLEEVFGLLLSDGERNGIRGSVAALRY